MLSLYIQYAKFCIISKIHRRKASSSAAFVVFLMVYFSDIFVEDMGNMVHTLTYEITISLSKNPHRRVFSTSCYYIIIIIVYMKSIFYKGYHQTRNHNMPVMDKLIIASSVRV